MANIPFLKYFIYFILFTLIAIPASNISLQYKYFETMKNMPFIISNIILTILAIIAIVFRVKGKLPLVYIIGILFIFILLLGYNIYFIQNKLKENVSEEESIKLKSILSINSMGVSVLVLSFSILLYKYIAIKKIEKSLKDIGIRKKTGVTKKNEKSPVFPEEVGKTPSFLRRRVDSFDSPVKVHLPYSPSKDKYVYPQI